MRQVKQPTAVVETASASSYRGSLSSYAFPVPTSMMRMEGPFGMDG